MKKEIQAKHLDTKTILNWLVKNSPATWHKSASGVMPTVASLYPDAPDKVILAKMRSLINQKLVEGCACGCSGAFMIGQLGKDMIR